MTPEMVTLILGPLGVTVLLLYIAKLLWDAHRKEDDARDARLAALDATNDKLADAVASSTAILSELRDHERERLARDRLAARGAERRRL